MIRRPPRSTRTDTSFPTRRSSDLFRFRVDDDNRQLPPLKDKLLDLSWYEERWSRDITPGSRWRLTLRLRAPRGLRNPGTIDTGKRALAEGIAATGYVRDPQSAAWLAPAAGIDAWRDRMSARIAGTVSLPSHRFLQSLALGDTRSLTDADWSALRASGLTHLIAISGFHVGLVAGFAALLAAALWWLFPALGRRLPRMQAAAIAALLGAQLGRAPCRGKGCTDVDI